MNFAECKHENCRPHWDWVECEDCGGAKVSGKDWGVAAGLGWQWHPSHAAAQFYRDHGRYPVPLAAEAAMRERPTWHPMNTAPKDGRRLLLLFRDDLPERCAGFNGIPFVGRHAGSGYLWSFAAPVGMGGFPDEWLVGWQPIPGVNT